MKIIGKMMLNYNDSFVPYLEAKVKFKVPNKAFKYTYKMTLVNAWDKKYNGDKSGDSFLKDCLDILRNKELLINIGKGMIITRMENEKDKIILEDNYNEINKLVKVFNKNYIDIEVEVK